MSAEFKTFGPGVAEALIEKCFSQGQEHLERTLAALAVRTGFPIQRKAVPLSYTSLERKTLATSIAEKWLGFEKQLYDYHQKHNPVLKDSLAAQVTIYNHVAQLLFPYAGDSEFLDQIVDSAISGVECSPLPKIELPGDPVKLWSDFESL